MERLKGKFIFGVVMLILTLSAWTASIQAEDVEIKDVTVTATRHEQLVEDVSAPVEIVDRKDIEAVSADNVEDSLRHSTSVYFYRHMLRSTPSIRGFEGKHTLILIDGRRYAGPQGKYDDPLRLTAGNIERIEIVRGPMSSLYGSEAMGGVINIITKKAERTTFEMDAKYGKYSHGDEKYDLSFNLNLADPEREDFFRKVRFNISGQRVDQDDLRRGDGSTLLPNLTTDTLTTGLEIDFTDSVTLELDGALSDTENDHILQSRGGLAKNENDYSSWDFAGKLAYSGKSFNAMVRGYYSHYNKDYEKHNRRSGMLMDFEDGTRETSVIEAKADGGFSSLFGEHYVTAGGEYRNEDYESVRIAGSRCGSVRREGQSKSLGCYDTDITSFYLQDEWQPFDFITLIPGFRYDHHDQFGSEWSPKVGLVINVLENLRLKANYGHAYRAPGPGELFMDFYGMGGRYHIIGNPDLDPETSDSFDAGLEFSSSFLYLRAGYFYNDVDDLIDTQFAGREGRGYRYEYVNINKAVLQGVELDAEARLHKYLDIGLNYTYLDARDDTTDDRLAGRPRHLANIKVDFDYLPWDLGLYLRAHYVADYGYEVGGGGTSLELRNDSSFTVDLKLTKGIGSWGEVYAGINDLFDNEEMYWGDREDDGILERPGSYYYAGIKLKF